MGRKIILTAAVNGTVRKAQNPAVPEQPAELAQAALECYNAGASVIHYHLRDETGAPVCTPEALSDVTTRIKAVCPVITLASSAPVRQVEESLRLLDAQTLPEMMSIACGLMHLSVAGRDVLFPCTRAFIRQNLLKLRLVGVKPELEIISGASADDLLDLAEQEEYLDKPLSVALMMGQPMQGVQRYNLDYLIQTCRRFPKGTQISVACAGPDNMEATLQALLLGGNMRVGMEETLWYCAGEPVKSNVQLVERAVRILRELGLELAAPAEARSILGLPALQTRAEQ